MQASIREWELKTGHDWATEYEPIERRSSFPWERKGLFSHLMDEGDTEDITVSHVLRHLQGDGSAFT